MVKNLQQQANEALSYISLLLRVDKEYDLILQLQNLAVNALIKAFSLSPEDKLIQGALSTQKTKLNEYKQHQRQNEIACWLTSDAELSTTQSQLTCIEKLLDLYRNKGDLSFSKYQELQNHLNILRQQLFIKTYLYQADICAEQNNITSYQLYIKRAIQAIKKADIESSLKNKKIKALSDRIQDVKRTGKATDFKNFIKPNENASSESSEEIDFSE